MSISVSLRADSAYEDMKQRYGTQGCYLLKINSRSGSTGADEQMPDPWSQYLHKTSMHNPVSASATTSPQAMNIQLINI